MSLLFRREMVKRGSHHQKRGLEIPGKKKFDEGRN